MANYASLKAAIQQVIKTNGNNEITGDLLQQSLLAMINSLGVGYQYVGIATPATNPGTPDQNVFYIASTAGTYTNFGGLVLTNGEIAILKYNGAWSKDSTGAATQESVNQLGQKFQGVLYEDLNGKTSKNLIDSNTVWTDGHYVNSLTGSIIPLGSTSVTEPIPVLGGTKMIFYSYSEDILSGGMALAIFDSSNRVLYDSESIPYFSTLQHISGYIYSIELPENAAYVLINVKTSEKSLAFINLIYNSDTKLVLPWLLLQGEQIPQILPNKIFSDNFIFEQEEFIVQNYTADGYINNGNAGSNIEIVGSQTIHSAIIPCQEGDVLIVKNGQFILPTDYTYSKYYYAFGRADNPMVSVVSNNEIQNYISVFNESEQTFWVKIPAGCGYFYLTIGDRYRADDNVKFCVVKQNLKWLEITGDNLSSDFISSLIQSLIPTEDFETAVADISKEAEQERNAQYHLWDSIQKKIEFNGKTIKFFGDSITAGTCSPNLGSAGNDSWPNTFSRIVGATASIYAVSGSCITDTAEGEQYNIGTRIKQFVQSTDEIIIIAGGTNDFNQGRAIGVFGDTQRTTFYGSLNDICSYIKTTAPDAVVIFVTPIPYTKPESAYPLHIASLNTYRSAIYDVATKYGYNVVDGNSLGMPRMQGGWNNFMCDDSDGCHPTVEGHKLMARNLSGKLL